MNSRTGFNISILVAALLLGGIAVHASQPVPFTAHAGIDLASDAARIWAPDAQLVYVENDEPVGTDGTAVRWGYLYYSAGRGECRDYTIREGKILEATTLEFAFDAPPIAGDWVDSSVALAEAERKAGVKYRAEHGGRLATMLLIRGAFHDKDPDAVTWAIIYNSDTAPALSVVVDASNGHVVRKWEG